MTNRTFENAHMRQLSNLQGCKKSSHSQFGQFIQFAGLIAFKFA